MNLTQLSGGLRPGGTWLRIYTAQTDELILLLQTIQSVGMWEAMTEEELDQMMDAADTSGNGTIEIDGKRNCRM